MFIYPVDNNNMMSFIHGYEAGTKHKCNFTLLLKHLLTDKYKIKYSNTGLAGQVSRFSEKLSLSWVITFKRYALEILADEQNGGLDKAMKATLKNRILSLVGRINEHNSSWFNDNWIEEWLSLCLIKHKWFKQIWTAYEWPVIKSIDKHIKPDNVYSKKRKHIPKQELLILKERFYRATKRSCT